MAAITPNVGGIPFPVETTYQQDLRVTKVTDGDTLTFREFTTLIQAECELFLHNGTAVTFTTGTNIVTIGVNVPPLAATEIFGIIKGTM